MAAALGQPLPWSGDEAGERRYATILLAVLLPVLLLSMVMPLLPLIDVPEEAKDDEMPERLARLVIEQQEPEPVPEPEPEPEPEPREQPEPEPEPAPQTTPRERAERSGVLAFADDLQELRENQAAADVRRQRNLSQGSAQQSNQRRLITSDLGGGTTGIASRRGSPEAIGDGTELAGHSEERVAGPPGGDRSAAGRRGGGQAARTLESIQVIFDRNKAALFSMYQRALRSNPALEGTVVLRLEIQPSGAVTAAEVVSSELNDAGLEGRIVNRVKLFDFGAKNVPVWRGRYPINFFPS